MSIGRLPTINFQARRRTAGAILAIAAAGLLGCEATDESITQTVSVVSDLGSESGRITLPAPAALGQRAAGSIEMTFDVTVGSAGRSEEIEATMAFDVVTEVIDVDGEGGYLNRQSWTNGDVTSTNSQFARQMAAELPERFTLDMSVDSGGNVLSVDVVDDGGALTDATREAAKQIADDTKSGSNILFPADPIGVGARWSTTVTQTTGGAELAITIDNELVEVTDDTYLIDVSIDDEIDERIESQRFTGTVAGSGSFTGSTTNPLVSAGSLTLSMDMRGGGMSMAFDIDIDVDLTEPV